VEPWWYFLPLLILAVLPWLAPLVSACRRAWLDAGPTPQFKPLKFLLIFAAVTLAFFSASGSKLAPYILPMLPPLAAITGVYVAERPDFLRRTARIGAATMVFFATGLLLYSARRNSFIPQEAIAWSIAAIVAGIVGVLLTWKPQLPGASRAWVALGTAATAIFAWQCLLCEYTVIPPSRSARDLVAAAKPYIRPETTLFSVGQYRETVSPYLQRTLTLVAYEGELQFGLREEPGKQMATPGEFVARWGSSTDAVAFFEPQMWESYRRRGLPGRVIAADNYTVAVSRL
jgi:4-amino-4-deoxy-L-arabinose transferase-like glycosyltransferase